MFSQSEIATYSKKNPYENKQENQTDVHYTVVKQIPNTDFFPPTTQNQIPFISNSGRMGAKLREVFLKLLQPPTAGRCRPSHKHLNLRVAPRPLQWLTPQPL